MAPADRGPGLAKDPLSELGDATIGPVAQALRQGRQNMSQVSPDSTDLLQNEDHSVRLLMQ